MSKKLDAARELFARGEELFAPIVEANVRRIQFGGTSSDEEREEFKGAQKDIESLLSKTSKS